MRLPKLINDSNRPLLIIMSIVAMGIWLILAFASPKDLYLRYQGVKYQAGNTGFIEPITIEIRGKYWNGLFGEDNRFQGQIMVGELLLDYTSMYLPIEKDKSASLELGKYNYYSTYGSIHMLNLFEKVTIRIYEQEGYGSSNWNSRNGWLISAPCNTRNEAVMLSNELIPYVKGKGTIK